MPHLPKLLARILSTHSLQDLGPAGMLIHESTHLVDIVVDDDVKTLLHRTVLFHFIGRDLLGHFEAWTVVRVMEGWK
jgi:hypothetical protein